MESSQDLGDEELVALCQQGQGHYFEVLVRRYMEKAFHIAYDFTRNKETAKDLSQDAFLRAYANITRFDGRSSFYTWFYRIVVNLCLDHARRNRRVFWESLDKKADEPGGQRQLVDTRSQPDQEAIAGEPGAIEHVRQRAKRPGAPMQLWSRCRISSAPRSYCETSKGCRSPISPRL